MGDPQNATWWQEIMQGLGKAFVWFFYIIIGVVAKLAFDSRNTRLTRRQVIVKSVLSIFCGYLAAVICENMQYTQWAKLVVPVATLLGESFVVYIMSNWRKLIGRFLPNILNDKK